MKWWAIHGGWLGAERPKPHSTTVTYRSSFKPVTLEIIFPICIRANQHGVLLDGPKSGRRSRPVGVSQTSHVAVGPSSDTSAQCVSLPGDRNPIHRAPRARAHRVYVLCTCDTAGLRRPLGSQCACRAHTLLTRYVSVTASRLAISLTSQSGLSRRTLASHARVARISQLPSAVGRCCCGGGGRRGGRLDAAPAASESGPPQEHGGGLAACSPWLSPRRRSVPSALCGCRLETRLAVPACGGRAVVRGVSESKPCTTQSWRLMRG